MAAVTRSHDFDYALAPLGYEERPAAATKGFWRRVGDAIIASRKAAAERELRRHGALLWLIEDRAERRDLPF